MPLVDAVRFVEHFLSQRGIRHVFVGGIAVSSLYDRRSTSDADILLLIPTDKAESRRSRWEHQSC